MLINSLGLKNFKCFEELDVQFAPITLLTGANSSGKSSFINAILTILQTSQFPIYLSPNGKYVNMGSFEEMLSWQAPTKHSDMQLNISTSPNPDELTFEIYETTWEEDSKNGLPKLKSLHYKEDDENWMHIDKKGNSYLLSVKLGLFFYDKEKQLSRLKEQFPDATVQVDDFIIKLFVENKTYKSLEELIHIIHKHIRMPHITQYEFDPAHNYLGSFRLPPERTYYQKPKANDRVSVSGEGYIDQIVEWEETEPHIISTLIDYMKELELLNELKSVRMKGGRFELTVKINSQSKFASLTDVGFGISQFLPIIVADLQLSENSCLAVSQPEIHLHPKIQATFGNYLANQIKRTKKQYIIETHSEYLLNRIRLLLVTGELKPEDVRVLYFENDGVKSTVHDVEFAPDGQIKGAPAGFFDTYGIDVMNIAMEAIG